MQILGLLGIYFEARVVFSTLFSLSLAILCVTLIEFYMNDGPYCTICFGINNIKLVLYFEVQLSKASFDVCALLFTTERVSFLDYLIDTV